MLKAYKYRLEPTVEQEILLNKHIGACRLIYNIALETKQYAYHAHGVNYNYYDLNKQIAEFKEHYPWLKEVSSHSIQQALMNLESAFTNFYKGYSAFPNFKSKSASKQSFKIPNANPIKIIDNKLIITKFQEGIKLIIDRKHKGIIKYCTITKTSTGKFFVSVLCETGEKIPNKKPVTRETAVGLDLGLTHFVIESSGVKHDNPRFLRNNEKRLKVLHKRLSRKKKGSKNRKKAQKKLAVYYEYTANCRKDFLNKLSTDLVNNHDTICIEDLNIKGMLQNRKLSKSISDAGWGMFSEMLKYKAEWAGKNILYMPRFQASSKICSICKEPTELTLGDRVWTCGFCDTYHDRDINAAKEILDFCVTNYISGNKPLTKLKKVPVKRTTNKTSAGSGGELAESLAKARALKQEGENEVSKNRCV
jgi:putative transposase